MRGGGRCAGGEEERRSAEAASGALWKGPVPKAGRCHRSGTTPHYTGCVPQARDQPSTTRDRPIERICQVNNQDMHSTFTIQNSTFRRRRLGRVQTKFAIATGLYRVAFARHSQLTTHPNIGQIHNSRTDLAPVGLWKPRRSPVNPPCARPAGLRLFLARVQFAEPPLG
jgi:hypothetical protein